MNQANCRERNGQLATARALFLEAAQQTRAMREPKWKKTHATATGLAARLEPQLSTHFFFSESRCALRFRSGTRPRRTGMQD